MNCNDFAGILADLEEGKLSPGVQSAAEAHLKGCASCRRLLAIARGKVSILSEEGSRELVRTIIERTSGSACPRVELYLCDFVDGGLDEMIAQLVAGHLAFCSGCRATANDLTELKEVLPEMAEIEPNGNFTREIVGYTSGWQPFRPSLRTRFLACWNRLVQRPRFSFEAAYLGTLMLVFAFGNPVQPLRSIGIERLGAAAFRPVAGETLSRLLPSGWVDAQAPVLRFARSLAAGVSREEQNVSGSLSNLMNRSEQVLASTMDWQVRSISAWSRTATGTFRGIWSNLVARIPRSKS